MDCIQMLMENGTYRPIADAPVENWEQVLYNCDSVEHHERLTGWGKYTDCFKVTYDNKSYYYFVELPVW